MSPPTRDTPAPIRDARSWLPLAGAVVLIVAVGVYAGRLQTRSALQQARLTQAFEQLASAEEAVTESGRRAREADAAMAAFADRAAILIPLAGRSPVGEAGGRAFWSAPRGLVVAAWGLPPAPEGRAYQVWITTGGEAVSAGLLAVGPTGTAASHYSLPRAVAGPISLSITLEPAGGAPVPTGEAYLTGVQPVP